MTEDAWEEGRRAAELSMLYTWLPHACVPGAQRKRASSGRAEDKVQGWSGGLVPHT